MAPGIVIYQIDAAMEGKIDIRRGWDGAAYRTRTCDPRITNAMLYQLS